MRFLTTLGKHKYFLFSMLLLVFTLVAPKTSFAQTEEEILNSVGNELESESGKAKEEAAIEKEYKALKAKAESSYKGKKYAKAKTYYADMLKLKPDSEFAEGRLALIDQLIAQAAQAAIEKKYNVLITQADALLASEKFSEATEKYKLAAAADPDQTYPKTQIKKVATLQAEKKAANAAAAAQAKYDAAISKADQAKASKNWDVAKQQYALAAKLKSTETYPTEQLALVDKLKAEEVEKAAQLALDKKFNFLINAGDKALEAKDWDTAKSKYKLAMEAKLSDESAKKKFNEVDGLKAKHLAAEAQAKADREYKTMIVKADQSYAAGKWKESIDSYKLAKGMKPSEAYAGTQITKAESKIQAELDAEKKAAELETEFAAQKKIGEEAMANEKWQIAIDAFSSAQALKPQNTNISGLLTQAKSGKKKADDMALKKKAEFEAASKLQKQYDSEISKGDAALKLKKWEEAKLAYTSAKKLKPTEPVPANKLTELEKLVDAEKAQIAEEAKIAAEKAAAEEAAQLAKAEAEKERIAEEKRVAEAAKVEAENKRLAAEAEALAAEKVEAARLLAEKEQLEKEALQKEEAENKRLAEEAERLAAEKVAAANSAAEKERIEKEALEKAAEVEAARLAQEAINKAEAEEKQRIAKEAEAEAEKQRLADEAERIASENAESERLAQEKLNKAEEDRLVAAAAEANRLAIELANKEKLEEEAKKAAEDAKLAEIAAAALAAEKLEQEAKAQVERQETFQNAVAQYQDAIAQSNWTEAASAIKTAESADESSPKVAAMKSELQKLEEAEQNEIASQKAAQEKEKALETAYNEAIKQGDKALATKDYKLAKKGFESASKLKPNEEYPKNKIIEIKELELAENEAAFARQQELDKKYSSFLAEGEAAMKNKNWEAATNSFNEALKVNPEKQGPKERIAEIESLIQKEKDLLAQEEALETDYIDRMANGNTALNNQKFAEAKRFFMGASKLKPNEAEPKEKLAETTKLWDAYVESQKAAQAAKMAEQLEDNYNGFIMSGDQSFQSENWDQAIKSYQGALSLKSDATYPAEKLAVAKIKKNEAIAFAEQQRAAEEAERIALEKERALQEQESARLASLEADFTQAMENGNSAMRDEKYKSAVSSFKSAVNLKPDNQNAISKLDQAKAKYAEGEAVRMANEKERQRLAAIELKKKQEEARLVREAYLAELLKNSPEELAKNYPNGITEEIENTDDRVITKSIIVENGEGRYLLKFAYPWGEEFYYLNGKKIRADAYNWNVRKFKF